MYVWFTFWGSNKTKCSGVQYKVLLCTKSSSPFKKNAPNDLFYVKKISQEKRLLEAGKIDCCQYLLSIEERTLYFQKKYKQTMTLACRKVSEIRPDLMSLGLAKGTLCLTFGSAALSNNVCIKERTWQQQTKYKKTMTLACRKVFSNQARFDESWV